MVLLSKNSFEAVCVFNAVCECVIIQSLCSKEYKSIGISAYSSHVYFTRSRRLTGQTNSWSVAWRCRSHVRGLVPFFPPVCDWSARTTGNEVRVEQPVELMTMIKTRVLEGRNLHPVLLLSAFPPPLSWRYNWTAQGIRSLSVSFLGSLPDEFPAISAWLPTTSSFLKKTEVLFLVDFAQFICFSSAQIECYAFTIILSELNCILLSGRFGSASDL